MTLHLRIIDRRPFFNGPPILKTPPLGDVRDAYLFIGPLALMWRVEMPIGQVREMVEACRTLEIPIEYDYGTSNPNLRLPSGIPGIDGKLTMIQEMIKHGLIE